MQRKFLEELGIEKNAIDKIMSENGSDINNARAKAENERDELKTQLESTKASLKEFEGIDVGKLSGKVKSLNEELAKRENEYAEKINAMEFGA